MRGRKPKPNAMKAAEGSRAVRPEPTFPGGVGCPPTHLNRDGKQEWHRVTKLLEPKNILQQTDRQALAAYCAAYAQWVAAERVIAKDGLTSMSNRGVPIMHPAVRIKNQSLTIMRGYLAEFGLTPATRQRLGGTVSAAKPGDELEGFMRLAQ